MSPLWMRDTFDLTWKHRAAAGFGTRRASRFLKKRCHIQTEARQMIDLSTITVTPEDGESRLDRWFRRHYPALNHGRLEKLLRTGQIRVDGKKAKSGDRVSPGMAIRVPPMEDSPAGERLPPHARPQDEALLRDLVIHQDDHAIVINKPPGLAVQGGSGTTRHVDGMLDGLRFGHAERPRLVHRLDKDTSGVLLRRKSIGRSSPDGQSCFRGRSTSH